MCNTRAHARSSKQAHNASKPDYDFAAVYAIECCSDRDFCNDGEFPDLPPTSHHEGTMTFDLIVFECIILLSLFTNKVTS